MAVEAMSRIWIIARNEYLQNVRRTGFIVITAVVPILGLAALLIATLFSGQASSFLERQFAPTSGVTGVVDQLGSFSPILTQYQDSFRLFPDEEAGRAAVQSGDVGNLLIVPKDYISSGRLTIVTKGSGLTAATVEDSGQVRAFFVDHLLRDQVDPALRQRLAASFQPVFVSLNSEGQSGRGAASLAIDVVVGYILGLVLIVTIFVSSGYLLRSVSEEKTSRVIEIVLSSVTAEHLLAGKVLGLGALGLTQVAIWLVCAFGLTRGAESLLGASLPLTARPEIFLLGIVYYILGYLVYAVLTAAVGALGTTMQESQQLAGIFSVAAAIPLMLGSVTMLNPDMTLLRVLSWFPLTASTMMLLRYSIATVPLVDVIGSIVLLIAFIPLVLLAGAKVFRTGLLMYGKRPSFGQVVRALRQA